MRTRILVASLIGTSLVWTAPATAQGGGLAPAVSAAMADKAPCLKAECLPWKKTVTIPTGVLVVTRCATSPSQQVELALAARMVARETNNPAWNDLAVIALASAFIHEPDSYALVQASPSGAISELDARLTRGELGSTLRPGGGKAYLDLAATWWSQPQCGH